MVMKMTIVQREDAHLTLCSPSFGQSSGDMSNACTNDDNATFASTSAVSGMITTIRGAPSTPLNIRDAETKALRLTIWVCFA